MKTKQEIQILTILNKMGAKVKYAYDGPRSTAIIKVDDKYYIGRALLSKRDQNVKKIARIVTLNRAMKNLEKDIETDVKTLLDYEKFKEDVK